MATTTISDIDFSDDKSIVAFVENTYGNRYALKYQQERDWFVQIMWFAGEQNTIWNDVARQIETPKCPPWRVRLIINYLQSRVKTLIAKYVKDNVEWDVIPATTDIIDQQVAQLDLNVLNYYSEELDLIEKQVDAVTWSVLTGNGFLKPVWNPNKGDPFMVSPEDLLPKLYQDADEKAKALRKVKRNNKSLPESLNLGDIDLKVVSPFELLFDEATDIADAMWSIESYTEHVGIIKSDYGAAAKHVTAEKSASIAYHLGSKLKARTSLGQTSFDSINTTQDSAVVHECYIKPYGNGKYKDGLFVIVCQGKILKKSKFPYTHRKLPYVHIREVKIPGHFWATCTAKQLIHPQAELNKTRSQLVENRNTMGKPKWIVDKTAGLNRTDIDSEPGEVIEKNPGSQVEMVSPPSMPSYVQNMMGQFVEDINEVSGVHEISRAQAPGEVRGTGGILALMEKDDEKIAPFTKHLDNKIAEAGAMILSIACQYISEDRVAMLVGEDNELMIFEWRGENLMGPNYGRPGINYFKVRVAGIPGMPRGRIAQATFVDNLVSRNILDPKNDRDMIFKLLNIGQARRMVDQSRVHRSQAVRENIRLQTGEFVPVYDFQNDDAHIEVHQKFQNSLEYEELPDDVKEMFILHVQKHKEAKYLKIVEPQVMIRKATQQLAMRQGIISNDQGQQGNVQGMQGNPQQASPIPQGI
jgi:hypothetical protein